MIPLVLAVALTGAAPPDSPVADAAQRAELETVRALLQQGADVNAAQGDGMTALHWAAQRDDAVLAEMLIHAGANVHAGTRIGRYTPLHVAGRAGSTAVARLLLLAGSDPAARTTNSGVTPLHLAAESGEVALITALLDHGADADVRESAWGQTPLIFAAANNRAHAIGALLARGADPGLAARAVDVMEWAEADRAANDRLEEMLESFRKQEGGGPGWQPSPSQVQAALGAARAIKRDWPDVQERWKAIEEEERRKGGEGEASEPEPEPESGSGSGSGSYGKDDADNAEGEPKLRSYAELVGRWGGLTPLLHAVRQGHAEAALALLDSGADIDQPSAGDGTTPLVMAAVNGQFDVAALLLERGADPSRANDAGTSALYAVLERQWAPKASYAHPIEHQQQQTTYLALLEALLEAGADPDSRLKKHLWHMEYTFGVLSRSGVYTEGATPFWRAAFALDVEAMRLLVAYGADPDIPTVKPPERRRDGDDEEDEEEEDHSGVEPVPVGGPDIHPLHAASGIGYGVGFAANAHRHVPGGWMAAVRFLVEECGADVNARDRNAYTPLHHAASRGDNEMIRYLVEHGADVTAVSRKGQTTADMANGPVERVQPFPETVRLLEELGSENSGNCVSC